MTATDVLVLAGKYVALVAITCRLFWLVALDAVSAWPRKKWDSWTGRKGYVKANLFYTCPWCMGFWIGAALVAVLAGTGWMSLPLPVLWPFAINFAMPIVFVWMDRYTTD